jgi:hypothetical protein
VRTSLTGLQCCNEEIHSLFGSLLTSSNFVFFPCLPFPACFFLHFSGSGKKQGGTVKGTERRPKEVGRAQSETLVRAAAKRRPPGGGGSWEKDGVAFLLRFDRGSGELVVLAGVELASTVRVHQASCGRLIGSNRCMCRFAIARDSRLE